MIVQNLKVMYTMKNKYIKIKLNKNNEFRTTADLTVLGDTYFDVNVKIDTGCPRTVIPVSKLGISKFKANILKTVAIADNTIEKSIGFGVNDTEEYKKKAKEDFEAGNYAGLKSISFTHKVEDFFIDNVPITKDAVRVNYDGVGNVLIGMDIMKDWDIHIGTTPTGETLFLACPQDQLNDEYFMELNRIFGIGDSIITAESNNN